LMMSEHLSPETISAYVDAELAPRDREGVERHLAACPNCSAIRRSVQAASSSVAALGTVRMSAAEHDLLMGKIVAARRPSRTPEILQTWLTSPRWALAGGMALVVVAVMAFGVASLRQPGRQTAAPARESGALNSAAPPTSAAQNSAPFQMKSGADSSAGNPGRGGGGSAGGAGGIPACGADSAVKCSSDGGGGGTASNAADGGASEGAPSSRSALMAPGPQNGLTANTGAGCPAAPLPPSPSPSPSPSPTWGATPTPAPTPPAVQRLNC
jgi:hypothetical protein